jgi:tetratricopeptide (TPR) repeat protein
MLFMFEYIMRLRQKSVENQLPTATLIVPFFELLDKTSDLSLDALAAYFNRSVTDTAFQGTREQKQRIATICYEVILRTIDTQGGASHTEVMNLIRELEAMECMDPVYYNQILTALKGIVLDTKLVLGKESEALLQLNELIQHIQLNFAQHPVFFDEVVMPFLEYINHYVAESEEEWPSGKLTHVQDIQERIVTLSELFALATTYQLDVDSDYRAVKKAIPKGLPAIDDIILHMEYWLHQHILPVPIQALLLDTIDDIWRAIRTSHPESLAAIIDVLEDKIALEPDGIEYYKAKIRCYEKQHQTQQITALQAELVRRFPALVEDPFLLKSWSRACLAMGQYSIAIDALKNIVTKQRYPQSNGFIEARLNLAYAYYATGEQAGLQDAEAIYQSELAKLHNRRKIGPREQRLFGEIYLGLARCKCRNKLFSEAMTYLLSILEPDHRVLFFQALVYQFQNQFLDAIAIGESLIAEGFWDAAPMLIQTYLRLQQSKEIDAKVDGLIRLIQSDAARLNSKAAYSEVRILLALKRYDDALTRLNHIVGESGHNQFTYRFMSRCYCKLNRREEAMALLDDIPEGNEKRFITEELQRTGGQHRFFQPAANHHDLLQELALDSNTDLIGIGNGMGFTDPYSHFVYRREIEFNNTSDFVGYGFY